MACYIHPGAKDRCIFVFCEGDTPMPEMAVASGEANGLLAAKHWRRVVVDLTGLISVPPAAELFNFVSSLPGRLPSRARVALVVRPEQTRHARLAESAARNGGVRLAFFPDLKKAANWVKAVERDEFSYSK